MYFCLLTAMTRSSAARDLLPMILDGRAKAAASLALSTLETMATRQGEAAVELSSLSADLMLAQDCAEDAEDLYRQALVAATADRMSSDDRPAPSFPTASASRAGAGSRATGKPCG